MGTWSTGPGAPPIGAEERAGQEAYEGRALARARAKLDAFRSGALPDGPAGRAWGGFVAYCVLVLPLALLLLGAAVVGFVGAVEDSGCPYGIDRRVEATVWVVLMAGLTALAFWGAWAIWAGSKPDRPDRALLAFYRAVANGRFERAQRLVLSADLDDFPRHQPQIPNLGQPSGRSFPFAAPGAFATYWSELLRSHMWPYCLVRLKGVKVTRLGPDLAVAELTATFQMNTQIYWLLVFASLLIAVIVDLATRKRVTVDLRKILVRVGDEWHLLSGDFQGYEEWEMNWLPAPTPEASPYRGGQL